MTGAGNRWNGISCHRKTGHRNRNASGRDTGTGGRDSMKITSSYGVEIRKADGALS